MINLQTALSYANQQFLKAGISSANLDSRLLLAFSLNESESYILMNSDRYLMDSEYEKFTQLVKRRLKYEPIAYIIGQKEFYGYNFFINQNVLIPRPSTELIIDVLLKEYELDKDKKFNILDLGVGSGCIIITLLLKFNYANGIGVDVSKKALNIAIKNARVHCVYNRLKLIHSNWFEKLQLDVKYDFIVANPPYISENDINIMSRETLLYEPRSALFSANNGIEDYKIIAASAKNYLKKEGKLILEIGFNQYNQVVNLFLSQGFELIKKIQDLEGYDRVIIFRII